MSDEPDWRPPETAPRDGTWMLTKSEGEGLPYGEPVSFDFHFWDDAGIIRRVDGELEYEGAFRKFKHAPDDSHWDRVVGWIPWERDLHADYEVFCKQMFGE